MRKLCAIVYIDVYGFLHYRLSLVLKKIATASTAERFAFVDEIKNDVLSKKYLPKDTEKHSVGVVNVS